MRFNPRAGDEIFAEKLSSLVNIYFILLMDFFIGRS